jgi:hypothetical protein
MRVVRINTVHIGLYVLLVTYACSPIIKFDPYEGTDYVNGPAEISFRRGASVLQLRDDHSYKYFVRQEGGYIERYNRGSWTQNKRRILLVNGVVDAKMIPSRIRINDNSNSQESLVIVNIHPRKDPRFVFYPGVFDLADIDIYFDSSRHKLEHETSVMTLTNGVKTIRLTAHPKQSVEHRSELLNDVLYTEIFTVGGLKNKVIIIDAECGIESFAQVKMNDDTIQIVNQNKVRLHGKEFWRVK